jgi:hypothetical protein
MICVVSRVEDGELRLEAEQLGLLAHDAHAQRVEGAHREPLGGRARPSAW